MYKKSWGRSGVSPIIAAILMVAMSVVLTAVLFFTVEQMAENNTQVTPIGMFLKRQNEELNNYTVTLLQTSAPVEYEDIYFVVIPSNASPFYLGNPYKGLVENLNNTNFSYEKTPNQNIISASDRMRITGGYSNEWEETIIRLVYIPTGGQIAEIVL